MNRICFDGKVFGPVDRLLALVDGECSEVQKVKYLETGFIAAET